MIAAGSDTVTSSPTDWADASNLKGAARLVFFDLVLRGSDVTGIRSWARTLGLNERTVKEALSTLQKLGVVALTSPARGCATRVSLTSAAPGIDRFVTQPTYAQVHHPAAEIRQSVEDVMTPPTLRYTTPSAELPHPYAQVHHPAAEIHQLAPPLRKKEELSLLKDLSEGLSPTQRLDFWSESNKGGRQVLATSLSVIAERTSPREAVRSLLTAIPPSGVRSIMGFLVDQARRRAREGERPLGASGESQTPPPAVANDRFAHVRLYAEIQAASVRSADDLWSVRRGIELEYRDDDDSLKAGLDAFDLAVAL